MANGNKPLIRSVDAIQIPVPDLDAGLAFYGDRLGHELIWRDGTSAGLRMPESDTELLLVTSRPELEPDLVVQLIVVRDPWGNRLVLLDRTKGRLVTDAAGNVVTDSEGNALVEDGAWPLCGSLTSRGASMSEQVVAPRIRGFIATNSHPDGCAANVRAQIAVAQASLPGAGIGTALVVGSSTGYGLASALCTCFGYGARTLGVCFERASTKEKGGSAGWYNVAEAHRLAREQGRMLETINGDAFSDEIKQQAIQALKARFGKVDLLVYSLAAPRREGADGTVWNSVLKPIGSAHSAKAINLRSGAIEERHFDQATDQEIADTVKVMGGEDWAAWVEALRDADLLADGFRTVAYSYIGPQATQALYRSGTIGHAKEHLEATARRLSERLSAELDGGAWVSVNKAVVTQASAAIPGVPLYIGILFKVMKERGLHEGTIEQIVRLCRDHIAPGARPTIDEESRIRLDNLEMTPEVQTAVDTIWEQITTENLNELSDYEGYQRDFRQLFGFDIEGIDYDAPTEMHRELL